MKHTLEALIQHAIETLKNSGFIEPQLSFSLNLEYTRHPEHGDFATPVALSLAKQARLSPRKVAEQLIAALPPSDIVVKVEIAGPGFINFFVHPQAIYQIIQRIHQQGRQFGLSSVGAGQKIQVEFVSANPTGPLHVGHGRGAVYGSAVASLLTAVGFEVQREYYVNDAGRQMDILATSVWLRYLEECSEPIVFPSNAYRGDYVRDIARSLHHHIQNEYRRPAELVFEDIPADEPAGGDKEKHIDALIERAKTLLGSSQYRDLFQAGLNTILADIKADLAELGICYDAWFSERQLLDDHSVNQALQRLQQGGFLYQRDGATWFASSNLGDEKDRVVIRDNGQYTYFASDIAYHLHKLSRGFDRLVNVWGADHHGYIPRVKAAIQALGANETKLVVLLVQFAVLYRGTELMQMSTRSGEFVTLRQLRDEVGKDAARFFYLMRKSEQHLDFDLKLATEKTTENPVYYVQYAHARICSVFRQLAEKAWLHEPELGMQHLTLLTQPQEIALASRLSRYSEVLNKAALQYEPHLLVQYLRELAQEFHTYYNALPFLVDDVELRNARLNLISAVRQILDNGLTLLGISSPEAM
jgi:arginyl-tRNA synthetase